MSLQLAPSGQFSALNYSRTERRIAAQTQCKETEKEIDRGEEREREKGRETPCKHTSEQHLRTRNFMHTHTRTMRAHEDNNPRNPFYFMAECGIGEDPCFICVPLLCCVRRGVCVFTKQSLESREERAGGRARVRLEHANQTHPILYAHRNELNRIKDKPH